MERPGPPLHRIKGCKNGGLRRCPQAAGTLFRIIFFSPIFLRGALNPPTRCGTLSVESCACAFSAADGNICRRTARATETQFVDRFGSPREPGRSIDQRRGGLRRCAPTRRRDAPTAAEDLVRRRQTIGNGGTAKLRGLKVSKTTDTIAMSARPLELTLE